MSTCPSKRFWNSFQGWWRTILLGFHLKLRCKNWQVWLWEKKRWLQCCSTTMNHLWRTGSWRITKITKISWYSSGTKIQIRVSSPSTKLRSYQQYWLCFWIRRKLQKKRTNRNWRKVKRNFLSGWPCITANISTTRWRHSSIRFQEHQKRHKKKHCRRGNWLKSTVKNCTILSVPLKIVFCCWLMEPKKPGQKGMSKQSKNCQSIWIAISVGSMPPAIKGFLTHLMSFQMNYQSLSRYPTREPNIRD